MTTLQDSQILSLEEKLAEHYWYWRDAMDSGNDIDFKAQGDAFLAVLRVYQDALRAKGNRFV